ncbi:flagellar biosynthetic protein FliR [Desulfovibrio sp. X2]|nr:flagellar biosynthetic protein FliR [Desulfovibrio sp. X2]
MVRFLLDSRAMDIFNFNPATVFSFLLTFMRVSLVVFLLPFFGGQSIPVTVKAALCMALTLALWPQLSFPGQAMPADIWAIMLMLVGELVLGMLLGLVVQFMFAAIQMGGAIIGFQMGFTMVTAVDPMSGQQEPVTSHFLYMVSLMTFLTLDGHLYLLSGLAQSFQLIPPGGLIMSGRLGYRVVDLAGSIFVMGIKVAAPVMVAMLLIDVSLALISRVAPQMNLLSFGFPVKIGVGFLFLGFTFTYLSRYVGEFIAGINTSMDVILRMAAGLNVH